jgi:selenocysteine lyase/cysteine desulfurase
VKTKRAYQPIVHHGISGRQLRSHRVPAGPAGSREQMVIEVDDTVRVAPSFAFYNTFDEIDVFLDAVRRIVDGSAR